MKVSEYVQNYTLGNRICFWGDAGVAKEISELLDEIKKRNKVGIREEWQDVLHFLQMWMYWRFGLNQEIWKCTQTSVNKFMARVDVWHQLYKYCNLRENISGYAGNYNKVEKVIKQLGRFGISEKKARQAYQAIVVGS